MKADGRRRARFDSFLRSSVGDHLWLIILAFPSAAESSRHLKKSRPLTIGAKADILGHNFLVRPKIKINGRFEQYLTPSSNHITFIKVKMSRGADRNPIRGHRLSHAHPRHFTEDTFITSSPARRARMYDLFRHYQQAVYSGTSGRNRHGKRNL